MLDSIVDECMNLHIHTHIQAHQPWPSGMPLSHEQCNLPTHRRREPRRVTRSGVQHMLRWRCRRLCLVGQPTVYCFFFQKKKKRRRKFCQIKKKNKNGSMAKQCAPMSHHKEMFCSLYNTEIQKKKKKRSSATSKFRNIATTIHGGEKKWVCWLLWKSSLFGCHQHH